jgi:Leucine-rich repeat (LRR) protein
MKYLKYFENNINISELELKNLKGKNIPKHVGGCFSCNNNQLTSLEYGPETVNGDFDCGDNQLTSLEFCPEHVGGYFDCSYNELTSLEHCPEHVGGYFDCSYNQLTSLEYCPETVGGYFWCKKNPWTNVIPYDLIQKFNIRIWDLYTHEQKEKFGSYEYQKEYLTESPEKYKDLEYIGFNKQIKEEFDWLFNAIDMGLM